MEMGASPERRRPCRVEIAGKIELKPGGLDDLEDLVQDQIRRAAENDDSCGDDTYEKACEQRGLDRGGFFGRVSDEGALEDSQIVVERDSAHADGQDDEPEEQLGPWAYGEK